MANEFDGGRSDDERAPMTAAEAQAALNDVSLDGTTLAAQLVTPWWYHPTLGLILAVFVSSQAFPGMWPLPLVALGIIALPILATTYARRYGVAISKPTGPRSRLLMLLVIVVLIAAMASTVALKFFGLESSWALIPGLIAFTGTVILGRRYDEALRQELSAPIEEQL